MVLLYSEAFYMSLLRINASRKNYPPKNKSFLALSLKTEIENGGGELISPSPPQKPLEASRGVAESRN